jgi:polyphenol oxidase
LKSTIVRRSLEKNDWPLVELHGLTLVQSPLLNQIDWLKHAFTTRLGGNTPPPMDSFNLGRHVVLDGSIDDAMANRARLARTLGLPEKKIVPGQMHTTNIFHFRDEYKDSPLKNFDGVLTQEPQRPVLLHFADCVPVMLVDKTKRALCVMHAGWRGTAGGIAAKGVELMKEALGSDPADMVAAVGPAIGPCCYETGEEVAEKCSATVHDKASLDFLIQRGERTKKPHPDLKAFNGMQLYEAGVGEVDITAWCTACRPELFYSHRQSGGKTGRQGALACIL